MINLCIHIIPIITILFSLQINSSADQNHIPANIEDQFNASGKLIDEQIHWLSNMIIQPNIRKEPDKDHDLIVIVNDRAEPPVYDRMSPEKQQLEIINQHKIPYNPDEHLFDHYPFIESSIQMIKDGLDSTRMIRRYSVEDAKDLDHRKAVEFINEQKHTSLENAQQTITDQDFAAFAENKYQDEYTNMIGHTKLKKDIIQTLVQELNNRKKTIETIYNQRTNKRNHRSLWNQISIILKKYPEVCLMTFITLLILCYKI